MEQHQCDLSSRQTKPDIGPSQWRSQCQQLQKAGSRHTSTELTSLLSIELDTLRSFIFSNVSRDRGLRAILEASGAVLVRPAGPS